MNLNCLSIFFDFPQEFFDFINNRFRAGADAAYQPDFFKLLNPVQHNQRIERKSHLSAFGGIFQYGKRVTVICGLNAPVRKINSNILAKQIYYKLN